MTPSPLMVVVSQGKEEEKYKHGTSLYMIYTSISNYQHNVTNMNQSFIKSSNESVISVDILVLAAVAR